MLSQQRTHPAEAHSDEDASQQQQQGKEAPHDLIPFRGTSQVATHTV